MGHDQGPLRARWQGPAPTPINANKDPEVCGKHKLFDEGIVVDPNGGLEGVFVYLKDKPSAVHPDYASSSTEPVTLDNKNCRFEPHSLVLLTSQPLLLKNSDPIAHNSKIDPQKNAGLNPILAANTEQKIDSLKAEENLPIKVGCNIHPWMGANVLLRANPYAAASKADGTFEIKNLPAGKPLEFRLWHTVYLKNVEGKGFKADSKGLAKIEIKKGDNDLGDIKVPLTLIKK